MNNTIKLTKTNEASLRRAICNDHTFKYWIAVPQDLFLIHCRQLAMGYLECPELFNPFPWERLKEIENDMRIHVESLGKEVVFATEQHIENLTRAHQPLNSSTLNVFEDVRCFLVESLNNGISNARPHIEAIEKHLHRMGYQVED